MLKRAKEAFQSQSGIVHFFNAPAIQANRSYSALLTSATQELSPVKIRQSIADLVGKNRLTDADLLSHEALQRFPQSEDILVIRALVTPVRQDWWTPASWLCLTHQDSPIRAMPCRLPYSIGCSARGPEFIKFTHAVVLMWIFVPTCPMARHGWCKCVWTCLNPARCSARCVPCKMPKLNGLPLD
jgi:hypothetical protein